MTRKNKKNFSVIEKLRKEGKSTEEFELFLNNLSLEDIIALKLELSCKIIRDGKLYGLPLMNALFSIVRDATLKWTSSCTSTKREAARFLGLHEIVYCNMLKKYKIDNYFNEDTNSLE